MPQLRLERGGTAKEGGKLKPGPGRPAGEVASHQLSRIHAALIELVAEQGYGALTVRCLTQRAGVSSRTFYQHYSDKEACFLEVHRLVVAKGLRTLDEAQVAAPDGRHAVRLAAARLARDWGTAPREAHLLLVDPYTVGQSAREQLRSVDVLLKARLERCIADAVGEPVQTAFLARAIVDGLTAVACARLKRGDAITLANQASELSEWAGALLNSSKMVLDCSDRERHLRKGASLPVAISSELARREKMSDSASDHALLLAAVVKLAISGRSEPPTVDDIATTAGISRKSFYANFPDVEACVSAALDVASADLRKYLRQGARAGDAPSMRVYCALSSLCNQLILNSTLSEFCLGTVVASMPAARLRLQTILADELRGLITDAFPDVDIPESCAEASAGALLGSLRHYLAARPTSISTLTVDLTYLTVAPIAGLVGRTGAPQQERTLSAA